MTYTTLRADRDFTTYAILDAAKSARTATEFYGLKRAAEESVVGASEEARDALESLETPESWPDADFCNYVDLLVWAISTPYDAFTIDTLVEAAVLAATYDPDVLQVAAGFIGDDSLTDMSEGERGWALERLSGLQADMDLILSERREDVRSNW